MPPIASDRALPMIEDYRSKPLIILDDLTRVRPLDPYLVVARLYQRLAKMGDTKWKQ